MSYPCACIEEKINNKDITILGVYHTNKFLNNHYSFLKDKIKNSDAVILEQIVDGDFYEEKGFFGPISKMASRKPIYVVDPINTTTDSVDKGLGVAGGIMLAHLAYKGLVYPIKKEIEKKRNKLIELLGFPLPEKKELTRRAFLQKFFRTGTQMAVGASLLSGSILSANFKGTISEKMFMKYDLEDTLSYGLFDFRNLMIAEGIHKVTRTEKGKRIITIHGDAHSDPIHHYATNPGARKKRIAYYPYKLLGKQGVRKFRYKKGEWKLEDTIKF